VRADTRNVRRRRLGASQEAASSGRLRTAGVALAASALTLLVTSGWVGAQSGGSNQISACADARGSLRMVAATESCAAGETRVVWNTEGPQGAPGAVGLQGPAGAGGLTGATGVAGPRGTAGKVKLKFTGDLATQVLLKQVNKKLAALDKDIADIKTTVHFNKGYIKASLPQLPKIATLAHNTCSNVVLSSTILFGYTGFESAASNLDSCPNP
jgi:hypothetical protein